MLQRNERDQAIDFIKGVLMWGVVYGHTITAVQPAGASIWLHTFVRTYDMPFFMILSGWFFFKSLERNAMWKVIVNKGTTILVPIIIWTLLRGSVHIFGGMYYFLWAVVVCGIICAVVQKIVCALPAKNNWKWLEILMLACIAVALHLCKVPWNLFYLYPFFALGFCAPRLRFAFKEAIEVCLLWGLILGLCFWDVAYTPWNTNGVAWRGDWFALIIYAYRFILALLGIHFIWKICDGIRIQLKYDSWIGWVLKSAGRESMAIYLLHMFPLLVIKRIARICPGVAVSECGSIIGYVIAPIISFGILWVLLRVVSFLKESRFLKYTLGFKFTTQRCNCCHGRNKSSMVQY